MNLPVKLVAAVTSQRDEQLIGEKKAVRNGPYSIEITISSLDTDLHY